MRHEPWGRSICSLFLLRGFPGGPASAEDSGDPGSIPGSGRSSEVGKATHSRVLAGEWLSLLSTQRLALEEMLVYQVLGGTETHCGHNSPRLYIQ